RHARDSPRRPLDRNGEPRARISGLAPADRRPARPGERSRGLATGLYALVLLPSARLDEPVAACRQGRRADGRPADFRASWFGSLGVGSDGIGDVRSPEMDW